MNALLVIQKDTDIIHKTPPSTEEIKAFEEETGDGLELNPMRLCFNVKITHCWNNHLAEQFVEWFMGSHDVGESQESLLHELFTNCFRSKEREGECRGRTLDK